MFFLAIAQLPKPKPAAHIICAIGFHVACEQIPAVENRKITVARSL